jgi:hypothetical protein
MSPKIFWGPGLLRIEEPRKSLLNEWKLRNKLGDLIVYPEDPGRLKGGVFLSCAGGPRRRKEGACSPSFWSNLDCSAHLRTHLSTTGKHLHLSYSWDHYDVPHGAQSLQLMLSWYSPTKQPLCQEDWVQRNSHLSVIHYWSQHFPGFILHFVWNSGHGNFTSSSQWLDLSRNFTDFRQKTFKYGRAWIRMSLLAHFLILLVKSTSKSIPSIDY